MLSWILAPFWNRYERRLRSGWRLLLHLVLFIFIFMVYAIVVLLASSLVSLNQDGVASEILMGITQSIAMLVSVIAAGKWLDRRRAQSFGVGDHWWYELSVGFGLGAMAMLGIFGIEYALGWIRVDRAGPDETLSLHRMILSQVGWFALMISVGFGEEFVSRGYHLKNLAEGMRWLGRAGSVSAAVLISSLVFGVLHASNDNASSVSTACIVLAGIMLAIGRLATGSLVAPIGLHISWNYFQGPVLGFAVSGNHTEGSILSVETLGRPLWTGGEFGPEAGLIGLITEICLIAFFIAWGLRKGKFARYATRLMRYQPSARRLVWVHTNRQGDAYGQM